MSLYSNESHSNRFILFSVVCVVFVLKQLSVCVWTPFAPKYLIKITHPGVLQKHDTIKYPSSDIDIDNRRKYELLKQYIPRVRMLNSFHFRQHTFLASFPSELLLPIVSRLFSAVQRLVVCCIPQTSPSVIGRGVNGTITRTKHGPMGLFPDK